MEDVANMSGKVCLITGGTNGIGKVTAQALAEQMHELYEEAQRAIEAKDDFFTVISHELRSPLAAIKASVHGGVRP